MDHNRKVLLSVVIAVICVASILSAYFVAGLFNRPPTITETRTLETVAWNGTRTGDYNQYFDGSLNSTYSDSEISVSMRLLVQDYLGAGGISPDYPPWVGLYVEINASLASSSGFLYDINVSFNQPDLVDWLVPGIPQTTVRPRELVLIEPQTSLLVRAVHEGPDAFMYLQRQNETGSVSFAAVPQWQFSSDSAIHSVQVDYKITYFNGTAYKRLVQPFQCDITT